MPLLERLQVNSLTDQQSSDEELQAFPFPLLPLQKLDTDAARPHMVDHERNRRSRVARPWKFAMTS